MGTQDHQNKEAACTAEEPDSFPAGWCAERNSWHFLSRLYQRYGITLEHGGYSSLVRKIRRGRWKIYEQSRDRTVGVVWHGASTLAILMVLDPKTGLPITVLPVSRLNYLKNLGDSRIACPICGRSGFKGQDGLSAHTRAKHPVVRARSDLMRGPTA